MPHILKFASIQEMFWATTPEFKGRDWSPMWLQVKWDDKSWRKIYREYQLRCDRRIKAYLIPGELDRVKTFIDRRQSASIRFGVQKKSGMGYFGTRSDFCLAAGVYHQDKLFLFYRAVEIVLGFQPDLPLIAKVIKDTGMQVRWLHVWAPRGRFIARTNGDAQRFHKRLTQIYAPRPSLG